MAANLHGRSLAVVGKRFANQISSATARTSTSPSFSRAVHVSVYDKNPEEHVHPTVVPDDLIKPQSDKYWAPHPQTGVFGPATEQNGREGGISFSPANVSEDSVLEQKAFFRPLEDLDKPPHP